MTLNSPDKFVGEGATEPFADIAPAEADTIAARHGTPTFVYDEARFSASAEALRRTWEAAFPNSSIYLSYKTNYLPSLCRTAHLLGLGADVVSGYELEHALLLCQGKPVVFNGPMKRREELVRAVQAGVVVNIDLLEEVDILAELRRAGEIPEPRLGLRVSPGLPVFTSADQSFTQAHRERQRTGKFGWPLDGGLAAAAAAWIAEKGFSIRSLHAHLNSQITETDLHVAALRPVLDFARELRAAKAPLEEINVGGGFGVPGMQRQRRGWWSECKAHMGETPPESDEQVFDMTRFVAELRSEIAARKLDDLRVSCEPGRYLMSDCIALLSRVAGIKDLPERRWAVLDAGLHIMPTAAFGERRRLRFFRADKELPVRTDAPLASLGGPLCYEGDVLMASARVPGGLMAGDLVLISDAGAYTVSRSTNFNQARAAVVARNGADGREIWRRESYHDIFTFNVTE
ncbi:diaminopimelate decarboxylase [Rhodovulum imhoffii]|uniref:Diaminopimelate decarboxylase n=1 Tax=Rhodovulum imhoffii TaxID=365340 RepID=A0A2T5BQ29_9RHOB|nr:hypothetical protein [Rhodovulum imhoffii]MBK5932476.1 hypothetical protein [Rhodovulum imhoffii]PTN01217.1 diaminopimelate decarboxylase [Rhodovulum imhoffii]